MLGGFTPGWLAIDVAPINDFLVGGKGDPLKDNGVFMYGGGGAAYIMLIPNFRVGGQGMSGSLKSTSLDGNFRRDAELNVSFGGVTLEYVIPVVERLDVAVGAMLGAGGLDLTLRQSNGGTNTWLNEKDWFGSVGVVPNTTRTFSGSFFVFVPSVNVEYALLGWFALRLGASYSVMAFPSWQVDGKYDLLGVPSKVSGRGFMIQAGLMVGTF